MATGGTAIWLHAASVGELVAARPLLRRLRERFPGRVYVVSTLTRTGLALAREMSEVHLSFLFPLDSTRAVRRLLDRFRLEAFLFTETEIWPTFLTELAAIGVPAFLVSGRVSARTMRWKGTLRALYRPALAGVTCCMQTDEDAKRIITLGADPRRVQVAGSLKFDASATEAPPEIGRLASRLGLPVRRVLVAGSTHEGEDEMVVEAFRRVSAGHRDLILLIAPRYPARIPGLAVAVIEADLPIVRYSELVASDGEEVPAPGVVMLDVVGPLAHCYELGTVAFVGGSLVPVGGHNVIEPARAERPILIGPYTQHAEDVVERLIAGGAALRVSSAETLAWALAGLIDQPARAADMGRRARALVEKGQGAVERHLKIIAARLSSAHFASAAGEA
jgi:3-deoxy-D-manno-octulosonic-acid transferase